MKLRAVASGTSLSEYLRAELARAAARPTPDELRRTLAALDAARLERTPADMVRELRESGEP